MLGGSVLSLCGGGALFPSVVSAFTPSEAMSTLSSRTLGNHTLSDFGSYTTEEKAKVQEGLSIFVFLEKLHLGKSNILKVMDPAVGDVAIEALAGELTTGEASVVAGGTTEASIGAELMALGEAGGTVAAGVSLLPLAGGLVYEDITSGSNFVSRALYSGERDAKTVGEGIAAEKLAWYRIRPVTWSEKPCSEWENGSALKLAKCVETQEIAEGVSEPQVSGWRNGKGGAAIARYFSPTYISILLPKLEGHYYISAKAVTRNSGAGRGEGEYEPVEPWLLTALYGGSVDGYPKVALKIPHTGVRYTGPQSWEAWPEYPEYMTVVFRPTTLEEIGLPKKITKAEAEKLEGEGKLLHKVAGHELAGSGETTAATEGASKFLNKTSQSEALETALEKWLKTEEYVVGGATVPSCKAGESGASCKVLVEGGGFTNVVVKEVGWKEAVITQPAESWIGTVPGGGSYVETTREIEVRENPDEEKMPVEIPLIKRGSETGTEYAKRLEEEGWTKVSQGTLTELTTDTGIGPYEASYTVPAEGSATAPGRGTAVEVWSNPATAPVPPEAKGGAGPVIPEIKMPSIPTPCNVFPFGVPCWLAEQLEAFAQSVKAPEFSIPVEGHGIPIRFAEADKLMEIVRTVEAVLGVIGVVLMFGAYASSSAGSSGAGGDD